MTIFICKVLIFFQMLILLLQYLEWIEFSATHVETKNAAKPILAWPQKAQDCGSRYSVPIKKKPRIMLGWNLKFFEVWGHQLRWHKPISMNYWPFLLLSNSLFLSLPLSVSLPLSPLCPTVSLPFLSHSLPSLSPLCLTVSLPSLSHSLPPLSVLLSLSPISLSS